MLGWELLEKRGEVNIGNRAGGSGSPRNLEITRQNSKGKDSQRILKIEFYRSPSLSLFKDILSAYPRPENNHFGRLKYRGLLLKTRNSAPSYQLDEKDLKFTVHCIDSFEKFFLHPEK